MNLKKAFLILAFILVSIIALLYGPRLGSAAATGFGPSCNSITQACARGLRTPRWGCSASCGAMTISVVHPGGSSSKNLSSDSGRAVLQTTRTMTGPSPLRYLTRRCGARRERQYGRGSCRVVCAPAVLTCFSSGTSMLGAHRLRRSTCRLLVNLLFSPTSLILIAASAALLVSIGVLLAWPSARTKGYDPQIVSSSRRNRKAKA